MWIYVFVSLSDFTQYLMDELAKNYTVETVRWITNDKQTTFDIDELISWIVVEEKKSSIANEKEFCDGNVLEKMIQTHQKLDRLSDFQLNSLRKKANVFEAIGRSIFIDRSAVKLANIDSLLDGMFTKRLDVSFTPRFQLHTVVFIGGDPGGFVDYVLWRKGWHTKCFGFAHKNLYKTGSFLSDPISFQTYDGPGKDGDITNPNNLTFFIDLIKQKNRDGISRVFADVALPIYRARQSKEIISKRLHLACCAYALAVLQPGGNFILKIFDAFTPFTVGLIYIMHMCFRRICIIKPHSSRPANSERYLICSDKFPESTTKVILNHLLELNETMSTEEAEISELVALDILKGDSNFYNYILASNNDIMAKQIKATEKIMRFADDTTLSENENELKEAIKEKFLKLWNLPLSIPTEDGKRLPDEYAKDLYPSISSLLDHTTKTAQESESWIKNMAHLSMSQYYFLPIENVDDNDRTYFLSKGKEFVYKFDKIHRIWTQITDIIVKLPEKTLVYGELIKVYDGKNSKDTQYLHIIDGYVLGGFAIHSLDYIRRSSMCHDFVLGVGNQRKYQNNKKVVPVESQMKIKPKDVNGFLQRLRAEKIGQTNQLVANISRNRYFVPKGMLVLNKDLPTKIWIWNDDFISKMLSENL